MYDTIIIGAGPAGLSAARILQHSQKVLIIDEYFHPGGRLLGQLYEEEKGSWWNGLKMADELYEDTKEKTEIKLSTSVYNVEFDETYTVYTTNGNFKSEHLIIATGAREKSTPLPGWDLPGVMTVGAAQVLTNFSRVKPGDKGVIVGVNPLSMVIGLELGYADIEVAKICLPQENLINSDTPREALNTLMSLGKSAPSKPLSLAAGIAETARPFHSTAVKLFPKNGVKAMGMPISIKEKIIRINGTEKVESVTVQKTDAAGTLIADTDRVIDCDFVCLSDGLAPLNEIASLLDLKHIYSEALGGYVPLHSEKMQTELPNLYVAGNITGIENAKIAIFQGELAAHQILNNEALSLNTLTKINNERKHAKVKFHKDLDDGKKMVQNFWSKLGKNPSQ
ncbi:NAD(P)/FAD-dependent oxidoreductase [Salinicoccus albus]|uniref:NAD(P)/FAD-dependent oxidoreductase n=1 Tax=Salinicoccus albus TaxID=418756 RepID=UPI0003692111|nr:FAD-dependent oxidoreductase [Salinicoccus albus]